MPLLKLETTVALAEEKKQALLASLSKIVAGTIGKPDQYVMVIASPAAMLMSGKPGVAAFVDIRSIGGLSNDVNRQLAQKICHLLSETLGVPPDRIYLNFTDVAAGNWGWNGCKRTIKLETGNSIFLRKIACGRIPSLTIKLETGHYSLTINDLSPRKAALSGPDFRLGTFPLKAA